MSKKVYVTIILMVIFIILISINSKCNAVTASFSVSPTSVSITKGATSSLTIKVSNCEGYFSISSSDTSVAMVSSSYEWVDSSTTVTITGKKAGTATITIDAYDVSDTDAEEFTGSKTIKVTVSEKTKSSDATLSNLGITPYDFSNFKSGTLSYNVTVPYETTSIKIYATANDSGATISGTGTKSLSTGTNTFNVKVTAEDGTTTKTYTLNITRSATSSVATLSNLGITPEKYDFTTFTSGTLSYDVSVPYEAETIEIYATATSSSATIAGTGTKTLSVGENTFSVKVTAQDGTTTKTYTLNITRKSESDEEDENTENTENTEVTSDGLINLEVVGYTLTPEFSTNVYEYQLSITDSIDSLEITTETSDSIYEVEVAGNENLQQGENVITILVYNTEDETTATYQIIVNLSEEADLSEINEVMETAQNNLKKQLWIIKGTIIIIVALIIIFLIERYRLGKKQNEEDIENIESLEEEQDQYDFKYDSLDENNADIETEEKDEATVGKRSNNKKGKRFK